MTTDISYQKKRKMSTFLFYRLTFYEIIFYKRNFILKKHLLFGIAIKTLFKNRFHHVFHPDFPFGGQTYNIL